AGYRRLCTYVILPSTSLHTRKLMIFTDGFRAAKDLPSFRMAPPAPFYRRPGDCICQIRNRTTRRLQDDAMRFDEFRRLPRVHTSCVIAPNELKLSRADRRPALLSRLPSSF